MVTAEHKKMRSRWVDLLVVAVASWVVACVITVVEFAAFGYGFETIGQAARDLFLLPGPLVPAVLYAACLGVDVFLRRGLTLASEHQRWTAGGWFGAAAVTSVTVLGLAWGGTYASFYLMLWSVLSGFAVLVFLGGAFSSRPAADLGGFGEPAAPDIDGQNEH